MQIGGASPLNRHACKEVIFHLFQCRKKILNSYSLYSYVQCLDAGIPAHKHLFAAVMHPFLSNFRPTAAAVSLLPSRRSMCPSSLSTHSPDPIRSFLRRDGPFWSTTSGSLGRRRGSPVGRGAFRCPLLHRKNAIGCGGL